jgi:fido (protein-threonine AMPylation protein)
MSWLFFSRRRLRPESVTREAWLGQLHRRMYSQVWAWAGQYRTTERNLGVPFWQVRMDMRDLEANMHAWLASCVVLTSRHFGPPTQPVTSGP